MDAGDFQMKIVTLLSKVPLKADGGTNGVNRECGPLQRSCVSKARNAGEIAFSAVRVRPSAEIVRVEGAESR